MHYFCLPSYQTEILCLQWYRNQPDNILMHFFLAKMKAAAIRIGSGGTEQRKLVRMPSSFDFLARPQIFCEAVSFFFSSFFLQLHLSSVKIFVLGSFARRCLSPFSLILSSSNEQRASI
jgi:hypothetical protein